MPRRQGRAGFRHRAATVHPDLRPPHQVTRWRVVGALGCLLAAWLAWTLAAAWHPSDSLYPLQGIDISHHQGAIDWARLPGQGVDFAYIKASEGGDHRDPAFAANWAGARKAGIRRGAYHFFTL